MKLVEFINVSKSYTQKKVIDNVSFSIEQNSIITLVGPNGAGKTTIAKMILGQEAPTKGQIKRAPNLSLGYVPQKTDLNTNLPMTVINLIKILTKSNPSNEILRFAKVEELKEQDISTLSGGQLRRVLLAGCLMNKAQLIILDEPTKDLDILAQSQFYQLLAEIKSNFATAIFIISHDLYTVIKSSDHVFCLNQHFCCYGKPVAQYDQIIEHIGFYQHKHNHRHN